MYKKRFLIPLILLGVSLLMGCSEEVLNQIIDANASSESAPQNQTEIPSSQVNTVPDRHQELLNQVNQERNQAGVKTLRLNSTLSIAAQKHAENMIATETFEHTINGKSVGDRATEAGYNWGRIGENIASGQDSVTMVMTTWMNSTGHRKNILKAEFEELGIGYAEDAEGTPYWVQVFGTPF